MKKVLTSYGAIVNVFIRHDDSLKSLGVILEEKLLLKELYFDSDVDPPYKEFGWVKLLVLNFGFMNQMKNLDIIIDFQFAHQMLI